jgi:archaellum biogenesis ATPase FlaH
MEYRMQKKAAVTTNSTYELNGLPSDRRFEELLHRIFEYRIKADKEGVYDSAVLMPGVAEKGVDVALKFNGKNKGAIQCKMNTSGNVTKPLAAKEIIKFALYYLHDNTLINDIRTFQYYLVISGKFASTAIKLLSDFNNEILKEPDFEKWTKSVLNEYAAFSKSTYSSLEKRLKNTLGKLRIKHKSYSEINGWLNRYPIEIVDEFFEIKKVIDNAKFEKGLESIGKIINPNKEEAATKLINEYIKLATCHLDTVPFIGHDIQKGNRPKNITLSSLYVEPNFKERKVLKNGNKTTSENYNDESNKLLINDVFDKPNHYIFLGDPGAGKSLMVKNLILGLLNKKLPTSILKKYVNYTPFRIELRKYNAERIKGSTNIISYLTSILKSEYQLHDISEKVIEYIIKNKPTIFYFDGLDEVFDLEQKTTVRNDIVNFTNVNNNTKVVITSRFRGYHDISFPCESFCEFEILKFSDQQVDTFVDKFYSLHIINELECQREAKNCKQQLRQVDNSLKSNPLILSLMSLLAINDIVIPDSKLALYRTITNTLVEKRDKDEKKINIDLKVKNKIGTLAYLAYWQYCQLSNTAKSGGQIRVTKVFAEKAIAQYLIKLKNPPIEDEYEAESAAKEFLDYTEKRSIYFDDNFTHKTFLEYFTADYILKKFHNSHKLKERDEIIKKYIQSSAWHIIFELLIAMIDEQIMDSDILDELIETHLDITNPNIVCFFLRILGNTENIHQKQRRKIIEGSINLILNKQDLAINEYEQDEKSNFHFLSEISRNSEFKILFQDIILRTEKRMKTEEEKITFYIFIIELSVGYHSNIIEYNINDTKKALALSSKNRLLFVHNYYKDQNSINEIDYAELLHDEICHFGLHSIFEEKRFMFRKNTGKIPSFDIFLRKYDFTLNDKLTTDLLKLKSVGLTLKIIKDAIRDKNVRIRLGSDKFKVMKEALTAAKSKISRDFLECILAEETDESFKSKKRWVKN